MDYVAVTPLVVDALNRDIEVTLIVPENISYEEMDNCLKIAYSVENARTKMPPNWEQYVVCN